MERTRAPGWTERGRASARPAFPSIYFFGFSATLPPFLAQSAADISTTPLPLHPFLPAHEFSAVAQEPCPLQALTPAQFTMSPPAFFSSARAVSAPAMIRLAAALAISTPLFTRMRSSLGVRVVYRSDCPSAANGPRRPFLRRRTAVRISRERRRARTRRHGIVTGVSG